MVIPKEFAIKNKGEYISAIETIINNIENNKVTLENYQELYRSVVSQNQLLLSQIENLTNSYLEIKKSYDEMKEKDYVKQALQDGMVPGEMFKLLEDLFYTLIQINQLKFIQTELVKVYLDKLVKTVDTVGAIDIKRDALKEFRLQDEQRFNFMKDFTNNKIQIIDDKIANMVITVQDKYNMLLKKLNNDNLLMIQQLYLAGKLKDEDVRKLLEKQKENIDEITSKGTMMPSSITRPVEKYETNSFVNNQQEEEFEFHHQPKPSLQQGKPLQPRNFDDDRVQMPTPAKPSAVDLMTKVKNAKSTSSLNDVIKKDFAEKKSMKIPDYSGKDVPDYNLNKVPREEKLDGERYDFD